MKKGSCFKSTLAFQATLLGRQNPSVILADL